MKPLNWKFASLTLAFASLAFSSGAALGGEILVNGGFESGSLAPWTNDFRYGSGTPWFVTSTGCYSGTYCAEDNGNIGLMQSFAGVSTNSITDVSFAALHPDPNVNAMAYDFFYTGGLDQEFLVSTSGTGWNTFNVTAQLMPNSTLVGFEIFGNSGGISMLDNISITGGGTVPEPGTLGLLLAGLTAVGAGIRLRNRKSGAQV
jgi:hypothetical protein